MKIYSHYGINDFIICLGYKGEMIKEYFANYHIKNADFTFDLTENKMTVHKNGAENWKVTLVDTGEATMTGGRLKKVMDHIGKETFCMSYGDGVSDINIEKLIEFHKKKGNFATLTAVQPPGRFGAFSLSEGQTLIKEFNEKPQGDGAWINGGYFVLEPEVSDYIGGDSTVWEQEPMSRLASEGKLGAYRHVGYWQNMDTLRDKNILEEIWKTGSAPWKVWK